MLLLFFVMGQFSRTILAVFCLVVLPARFSFAEGTRQVMPTTSSKGQLCMNRYRNDFALYNGQADFRLNITVADPTEVIRFGFGRVVSQYTSGLVYRIKDPAGNVVFAESVVPASGSGYISSYAEAFAGPFPANGGYNYLKLHPVKTGDYYLEFNYPGTISDDNRRILEFFDITVVNASGNEMNGRVWSKAWQFWSGSDSYSSNDRFYGKMMVFSDDSIVTQVDCNGLQGGSFSFSSNSTGCSTTGNLTNDRMSRQGFNTYPQYKVFLNDPDNKLYPTQKLTSGIILPLKVTTNCTTGGADFGINVEKDGAIRLLIEINPTPGADMEDVQFIINAKANPGGSGCNIISWDGLDNLGRPVSNGTTLAYSVTNLSGLTHLPIYDIENNDKGFIVRQIRPAGGQLRIYWDDTQIAAGTSNATTGCINSSGCHTWTNDFGNNRTINSWWYVSWTEISATPFITKKTPGIIPISGKNYHCIAAETLLFSVADEPNSTSYKWSYSGSGVTIAAGGKTANASFSPYATAGNIIVQGHNDVCGDGPVNSLPITFESLPVVALEPFPDICYTLSGLRLSGGQPPGGNYFVNGVPADSLFPYKEPAGMHTVIYTYKSPIGCSNSDTTAILLRKGPDCEGTAFFPEAFSPNNDNLNEAFRPVVQNVFSFRMQIFNRWGQLIFSTNDVSKGWDGTSKGKECPSGTYTYKATYAPSLRINENKTQRGVIELIR